MRKRPELRLVVASATLDAALFKTFFETNVKVGRWSVDPKQDTAVVMSVEGRQHSVDLCYLEAPASNYLHATVDTIMGGWVGRVCWCPLCWLALMCGGPDVWWP